MEGEEENTAAAQEEASGQQPPTEQPTMEQPPVVPPVAPAPPPPKKRGKWIALVLVLLVVVVIVAVAVSNLPQSTLPEGDGAEPSWREVIRFSGSTDKTTDSFFIGGERFRVNWTATADNEFGLLSIFVYKLGQSLWLETISVSWDAAGTQSDTSVVFDSGEVYLDMGVANLADYEVIVEEYSDGSTTPPPQTGAWTEVVRVSGSTDKTTDSFQIIGSKFRVTWSAVAENEFGLFSLQVNEPGKTLWAEWITVSWDAAGEKSDSTVVFESGEFYIDISMANLSSWSIIVEEWK